MNIRRQGFTIIELLVVIVVIGILASITIVTFNGVQQRARNAQTATAVQAYLKALQVQLNDKGTYPTLAPPDYPSTSYFACLGDNYPSNACWNGAGSSAYYENDTLNGVMKSFLGNNIPMPGLPTSNRYYNGILYMPESASVVNGTYQLDGNTVAWLAYVIDAGDTTTRCPVGPIASFNGATFSSTPPASGQTTAGSATANASCWIPLRK